MKRVFEFSREALFVFEEEAFVAGVEVYGVQGIGRSVGSAHYVHEAETLGDAFNNAFVLGFDVFVLDVAKFPV